MNRQLLVIDDDHTMHDLVGAHLTNLHTDCIFASSGAEGIQRAIDKPPTAILLDMDMPYMNGMEVCAKLKANPQTREIPIMFVTSDRTIRSKIEGIEMGAVDYVTKPFDPYELRARVRSVFRTATALQSTHGQPGIDAASGAWNRAFLIKQIESLVATSARSKQLVSCCFLAIDRFDELAQHMGQPGGADLIRETVEAMCSAVRLADFICRYDTRVIGVLGLVADPTAAQTLAERLCESVQSIGLQSFVEPEVITCSVGVAVSRTCAGPRLLEAAETALAEARVNGNQVIVAEVDSDKRDKSNDFSRSN